MGLHSTIGGIRKIDLFWKIHKSGRLDKDMSAYLRMMYFLLAVLTLADLMAAVAKVHN